MWGAACGERDEVGVAAGGPLCTSIALSGNGFFFLLALIKCRSALFGDSSPVSLGGDLRCLGGARGVISELASLAKTFPRLSGLGPKLHSVPLTVP